MLEFINKIKENKPLRIIGNTIYYILFVLIVLILLVVLIQKVSNNNISLAGFRVFNIASGSMMPVYEVGDILISKSIEPSQIEIGDDVVYMGKKGDFQGKTVTHRIIEKTQEEDGTYTFRTKGTANEDVDPTIKGSQIYGKIVYKVQTLSFISKIINNMIAFYFLVFIPLSIIIIKKILDIVYSIKHRNDEEDEETIEDEKQEDKEEQENKEDVNKKE